MSNCPIGPVRQGDSLRMDFNVQTRSGAPVVLTGATILWTISPVTARTTPFLTKSASITDAPNGKCSVMLDAGDLNQPGTFYHELEVRLTTGESLTASDGTFIVEPTNRPTT